MSKPSGIASADNEHFKVCKTPFRSPCLRDQPIVLPRTPRQLQLVNTPASGRKTPGDRFIPSRTVGDVHFSAYKLRSAQRGERKSKNVGPTTPHNPDQDSGRRKEIRERLLELKGRSSLCRVLSFKQTPVSCNKTGKYEYWRTYQTSSSTCTKKAMRKYPKDAEKVLDAPKLINDFYLNLVDWSKKGVLAIALGESVYMLDTESGSSSRLCSMDSRGIYVSSLRWSKSGRHLAVGTSDAEVQLWDVGAQKLVRRMRSHNSRVSSLAWNPHNNLLCAGSQSGAIHIYNTKQAQFHMTTLEAHTMDVCGLSWSTNGGFLASGGNDNIVCIWDTYSQDPWSFPAYTLKEHNAAIKALSWCPWRPSLLATGGGSADKTICLWNACSGQLEGKVDTGSQVSGLVWSSLHHELVSSHGHPHNQLTVWHYPSLSPLASLNGHEDRVLQLAQSPDGQTIASAGADETLRFWKCLASIDDVKKRKENWNIMRGNTSLPALEMPSYIR